MTLEQMIERGYEWCPECREVTIPWQGRCLWCSGAGHGATMTIPFRGGKVTTQ